MVATETAARAQAAGAQAARKEGKKKKKLQLLSPLSPSVSGETQRKFQLSGEIRTQREDGDEKKNSEAATIIWPRLSRALFFAEITIATLLIESLSAVNDFEVGSKKKGGGNAIMALGTGMFCHQEFPGGLFFLQMSESTEYVLPRYCIVRITCQVWSYSSIRALSLPFLLISVSPLQPDCVVPLLTSITAQSWPPFLPHCP